MIEYYLVWYHWKYLNRKGSSVNSSSILQAIFFRKSFILSELVWILVAFVTLGIFSIRYPFNNNKNSRPENWLAV